MSMVPGRYVNWPRSHVKRQPRMNGAQAHTECDLACIDVLVQLQDHSALALGSLDPCLPNEGCEK